ncbi:MAG: DUF1552 domain-containing protein [Polyangiaceae bacterium]
MSVLFRKNGSIGRRALLGGAGALLALPWLESLAGRGAARAAEDGPPRRFLAYYVPCGIHMPAWRPSVVGANYDLSPILTPLANVKSKVNVLTGLANLPARPDGPGDHASGTGAFITAAHPKKTQGADIQNGISVDQIVAQAVGDATRIPSLQIGIEAGSGIGDCDSGYSCAYARNISWASATQPLPKLTSPAVVFDQLFAGFDPNETAAEQAKRRLYRTSILDHVRADASSLRTRLGATDRAKLDQYLTGVDELATKIDKSASGPACTPIPRPEEPVDLEEHIAVMTELMVLAFQCDSTRVISFMLANAGSNRSYEFLGVSGGHHEISHHQDLQENFDKLTVIDTWEVKQFAMLLEAMDAVEDVAGGTLLDNSLVFFSSEISDGNAHNHDDMPVLLGGRAGGTVTSGRHITYDDVTVANLFMSIATWAGADVAAIGDSSGTLTDLA